MSLNRGDIALATLPFVTRPGSKLRPVLVVQNDANNSRMANTIVAFITSNTSRSHERTQVLIELNTPAGQPSGRIADSVVSCENLITVAQSAARKIGSLPADVMQQVSDALRASLDL